MTMNNQKYWEKRKAQQMFEYMEDAEKAAREFTKLYLTASREIQRQAKKIFRKYQSRYGLSRKEAELLLSKARNPEDIRRIIELLKDDPKNEELVKELESQAYGARIGRLNGLYNQLETVALSIYAAQQKRFYAVLTKLAKKVYYNSIFDIQQYSGYGFDFKLLDQKNIEKVLNSKWSGNNYSQTLWKNTDKLAKAVKKEIMLNLLMGKPVKDMSESIDQRFGAGYNEARRLIRTESSFVCNQMQLLSYDNCGIEKYIYVAILDLRTSAVCRSLDKKDFPVADATPGKNYPPMHPWCRSTTIAYMSKELLHKLKQSAIDPATGKRMLVPGDMTYQQWYDKYVKGRPKAKLNEKKIKNHIYDQKQHKKYREVLGGDVPEKLDDFQGLKYNEIEKWKFVKLDYKRRNRLLQNPELKLPNAENATAANAKFTKYLFDGNNPDGLAKGAAFKSRLGYSIDNWKKLQSEIIRKASQYPATFVGNAGFGDKYEQKFILYGLKGKPANVVVGWIRKEDGSVSMTSAYIKEIK